MVGETKKYSSTNYNVMRLRQSARAEAKKLGHDPAVFQIKRGVLKCYCKKCIASMQITADESSVTGSMLTQKCSGQVFLYRTNKSAPTV